MDKENIILKFNMRDYNNQLENILAQEKISEHTKNLLVSMLYKIENAYNDYKVAKGNARTKKEILEEILEIIYNDCKEVETLENKLYKETKIYINEVEMLYNLYQLSKEKFKASEEYEFIKEALENTLNQGYSIASSEIIRDFDGWSWNIETSKIKNYSANIIYQTLEILVGSDILRAWRENKTENYIDILQKKLNNEYNEELAHKILTAIFQTSILSAIQNNPKIQKKLIDMRQEYYSELKQMSNKQEYIEEVAKEKKKIVANIKKIDNTINNDKLLREEFISRNELLGMQDRIFSLSDLEDILEKEKQELMKKLNKYNNKMQPQKFIETRDRLNYQYRLLNEIEIEKFNEKILKTKLKELIYILFEALSIKIDKAEEKEEIITLLNIIRHYRFLNVDANLQIKDFVQMVKIEEKIITKACGNKYMTIFSKAPLENYKILKNILQTNIIELDKIYLSVKKEENRTTLEIYDEKNIDNAIELEDIKELNVKYNKRTKVFI